MREIEFRGKDVNSKRWVYGYLTKAEEFNAANDADVYFPARTIIHADFLHDVIPETVGEYTGLKDKDGKNIFEGDILECEYHIPNTDFKRGKMRHKVHFGNGRFYALQESLFDKFVIGNIHDNPELLREAGND